MNKQSLEESLEKQLKEPLEEPLENYLVVRTDGVITQVADRLSDLIGGEN